MSLYNDYDWIEILSTLGLIVIAICLGFVVITLSAFILWLCGSFWYVMIFEG